MDRDTTPAPNVAHQQRGGGGRGGGTWTSGAFDCFRDLETLWWTFWCPTLVFARTSELFEIARSLPLIVKLTVATIVLVIVAVLVGVGPAMFIGWIGFAAWRSTYRGRMRERLAIDGGACEDFALHACCMTCALSQEARQAKDLGFPPIEFCTGERLMPSTSTDPEGPSFCTQLTTVSKCSKIILGASAFGLFLAILASTRAPGNILIIFLALVEPAFILYLVYWRNHRRDASLDVIIKLFAVGFYWTSQFAAMTEPVLEGIIVTVASVAGLLPDLNSESTTDEELKAWAKGHMAVVVIGVFLMAFLVAATVEELYKFLIVRFCQLGGPLRNPHTILIYLISGAAGFACAENLAYVFGFKSAVTGVPVLVGELYVLGLRAIMPIHVICAGFQAINYVNDVVQGQRMSVPMLLLPAVLLHGTFDFLLMLMAVIQYIYDLSEDLFNVLSLGVGILIAIVSLIILIRAWNRQQESLLLGFHRVMEVSDVEIAIETTTTGTTVAPPPPSSSQAPPQPQAPPLSSEINPIQAIVGDSTAAVV